MNFPEEAPKLPLLPFAVGDTVLIATAAVIASRSGSPISPGELLAITVCVVVGAALLVVPFLANYSRQKDAELTERQNQLAALARTTAESAEQLGIAASGLHGIAESSKHSAETVSKLPAKIQERVQDVVQQFSVSATASQTALKDDISRLEAAADKIARAVAQLESASKARSDTLDTREAELAAALARATTQIDGLVANAITQAVRTSESTPPPPADTPKPKSSKSKSKAEAPPAPVSVPEPIAESPAPESAVVEPAATEPSTPVPAVEPAPEAQPEPVAPVTTEDTPSVSSPELEPTPEGAAEPEAAPRPAVEENTAAVPEPAAPVVEEEPPPPPPAAKPPRARKPKPEDDIPDLGLTPDPADAPETSLTSDGFTRLIATAYIGIGNKLYIRGEGPGLSWDKGVPLQFVSIGKWRWETPDATAPIRAKLYKNDQIECVGLGELTLEPGHQHEVNAGF